MLNNKFIEFNFYNERKKIKVVFFKNVIINYHTDSNSMSIEHLRPTILSRMSNNFKKIIFSYNHRFFTKIKYKGKGFKMRIKKKKKKIIKYWFGHSHLNISFLRNVKLKKCGKYKFTLKCSNLKTLNLLQRKISKVRSLNKYTKRGIRFSRMLFEKRKGKKSSYV